LAGARLDGWKNREMLTRRKVLRAGAALRERGRRRCDLRRRGGLVVLCFSALEGSFRAFFCGANGVAFSAGRRA